ncbi:hypothetical protein BH18CHL2_BH18CHL2_04840 [soil metagenome]
MDAPAVRAFLATLPARGDGRAAARVSFFLDVLQRPDIRYLVAPVVGGSAARIAAVGAAILETAGAPTGRLERGVATVSGRPFDEPLLARAGTLAAAATYQLGASRPDLGEPTRREVEVTLALSAFAEANVRVALLVDEALEARAAAGAKPDLVIAGRIEAPDVEPLLALARRRVPIVAAAQDPSTQARLEAGAAAHALPLLLGGRDFSHDDHGTESDVRVGSERYGRLPRGGALAGWELATGVAAALGLGILGIRLRPEWVAAGARAAATATMEP